MNGTSKMNTQTQNMPTVSVGGGERTPLAYKGVRVLTSERLARAFEASERQISDNFSNNAERFETGKHFYKVEGDELRQLKNRHDFSGSVGKNAKSLLLWTDRGAARHAKILNTDMAWDVYERLEDTYFAVRDGNLQADTLPLVPRIKLVGDTFAGLKRLAVTAGLRGNSAVISAAQATNKAIGVNPLDMIGATHLDAELQEQFINPTQIGQRTHPKLNAQAVNGALESIGLQIAHRRTIKGKDRLDYWELTEAGKKAGGDYKDTSKKHDSGTPVLQIKWPATVVALVQQHVAGPDQ